MCRTLLTIHQQGNSIIMEMQSHWSYGTRFIDVGYFEMFGIKNAIGANVQSDSLLFAIQEEGHLVLQGGKVNHEQGLNGDV